MEEQIVGAKLEQQEFTRKELYDLVWSLPMATLAKRFAISDTGLRKLCERHEIPVPKSGHWVRFKKKVVKPVLPKKEFADDAIQLLLRGEGAGATSAAVTPQKLMEQEIRAKLQSKLTVPEQSVHSHPLVIQSKKALVEGTPDGWRYKGIVSCSRSGLDTGVTKGNIKRALRFWDTMLKCLEALGHTIEIRHDSTYAKLDAHNFKLLLRERCRREIIKGAVYDTSISSDRRIVF